MKKINFQNGTLVSPAKVTIDNVEHQVTPAQYSGTTPMSAFMLNKLQDNIEEEIDLNKVHKYTKVIETAQTGGQVTLPCYYKVGNNSLTWLCNTEVAIKASTSDTEGQYYEVGETGSISNTITLADDCELDAGDTLSIYVRGEYSSE